MVVAVALWSLELTPGEPQAVSPPGDLRITNVALGDELADETGRTSVKFIYRSPTAAESDEEEEEDEANEEPVATVLCSLTPGKIEQATLDLVLEGEQEVLFELVGKNTVYLTGNYIDQVPSDQPPFESDESDGEDFDLRDVSSDVEMNPDELELESDADRFEEVEEEEAPKKDSKKRPREPETAEAEEPKLSKAQQKKLKKLKAADGTAVPTGTEEKPAEPKEKKEKKEKAKKEKEGGEKEKEKKPKAAGETKELAGGLKIKDQKVGSGQQAKNGDMVSVRYVGKLDNGKVFDSNTKGKPFAFRLGKGEVIKGWDLGVAGMQPGGERLIVIPPALAYGNRKQAGIPAGSTLTFEVKLLKIS